MAQMGELVLPDPPRLSGALREAAVDFYFNSWRLVPANVVWGALLLLILFGSAIWLPIAALAPVLALPVAGMHAMAALITRGEPVSFHDFLAALRRWAASAFGLGIVATVLAVVFTANVFIGLDDGGVIGWTFSAFALYADIALAMFLVAAWPLLVDPRRQKVPLRRRLWLAALVGLAHPGRIFVLTATIVALLVVSTVLLAALLTVSVAYVSLVATRYVLPAADRLEGRRTK